jgi:hypothetical protein
VDKDVEITLRPFDADVTFRLCRKPETLGLVEIDHWWLPTPTVIASAGKRPGNFKAVLDAYWQLCRQAETDRDPGVAESYLLANLLPHVRSIGSRRVVADGRLGGHGAKAQDNRASLDDHLRSAPLDPISEVQFRDQTADILGPAELPPEFRERYQKRCDELFGGLTETLSTKPDLAITEVIGRWQEWKRGVGRRAGREDDKRVLDVLSYEARAALYRCYSAIWQEILLPYVRIFRQLSWESYDFLEFWHLAQVREAVAGDQYFHLFHGHVFGLHPAGSGFIRTPTGKSLLGNWLQAERDPEVRSIDFPVRRAAADRARQAYGKVLQGLLIAVYDYAGRRADVQLTRSGPDGLRQLRDDLL